MEYCRKQFWKAEAKKERDRIAKEKAKNPGSSPKYKCSERNLKRMENPFRHTGSVLLKILKGTSTW